jgi:hypothetical protein
MTCLVALTPDPPRFARALAVGGVLFDAGLDVYRWEDSAGFNGYTTERCEVREENRKTGTITTRILKGRRYSSRTMIGDPLRAIRQFLVHHSGGDGKNPSGMFETLWRQRGLSVHFALEDDGRVFQFLDAQQMAWHAGSANTTSVGVECCLCPDAHANPNYYDEANRKRTGNLPHARDVQTLQGVTREVFLMPDPQVAALARLVAGTWVALRWHALREQNLESVRVARFAAAPRFPRIPGLNEVPTSVVPNAIAHDGLLGHLHVTDHKWDPAGLSWYRLEDLVAARFAEFCANLKEVV